MKTENTLELAKIIKDNLRKRVDFERLILFGKFHEIVSLNTELDFAVIINSELNKFDFISTTEEFAVEYISNYRIMFQFFPIHQFDFNFKTSAFIRSISDNGIEV